MGNTIADGLIDRWAEDAANDLGSKGWRDVDGNCMLLIIYAAQKAEGRKQAHRMTKPFWWLLGVVAPGVIWYVVSGMVGL